MTVLLEYLGDRGTRPHKNWIKKNTKPLKNNHSLDEWCMDLMALFNNYTSDKTSVFREAAIISKGVRQCYERFIISEVIKNIYKFKNLSLENIKKPM